MISSINYSQSVSQSVTNYLFLWRRAYFEVNMSKEIMEVFQVLTYLSLDTPSFIALTASSSIIMTGLILFAILQQWSQIRPIRWIICKSLRFYYICFIFVLYYIIFIFVLNIFMIKSICYNTIQYTLYCVVYCNV